MELSQVTTRPEPVKRGETFALLKIDCRYCDAQVIPGGYIVPTGVHTALVNEREVAAVKAMVEDKPEAVERAKAQYEVDLSDYITANSDGDMTDSDRQARKEQLTQMFTSSPSAIFRRDNKRDIRPFASVEVVEAGLLAPNEEERTSAEELMAGRIAKAVKEAMGGGSTPKPDGDMEARIAAAVFAKMQQQQGNQQKR